MKKNKQNKQAQQQVVQRPVQGLSAAGKKVILAGFIVLAAGYFILSKTDPAGQNLASKLSPFMILGGYALIGIGLAIPGKKSADQPK
jgi:hypothetical protein